MKNNRKINKSNYRKVFTAVAAFVLAAAVLAACSLDRGWRNTSKGPARDMKQENINAEYCSDFRVANVFSDGMVLQRNEYVRVWGFADEKENGKKISGEFKGVRADALIENGEWTLVFMKTFKADPSPSVLRVFAGEKEVVFENVLVGDVYMVSGQSNIAYSMELHWSFFPDDKTRCPREAVDPDLPIRLNYSTQDRINGVSARGTSEVAKDIDADKAGWTLADEQHVANFTALGYMFAYNYVKMTNGKVPVGLVYIDGCGRPLGCFLPNEVAEKYETDAFSTKLGYYLTTGVNGEWGRFLYNEYFYPFEKMAINGFIWYQGESDFLENESARYSAAFTAMIDHMRAAHNLVNPDFPVYYVEFPPIYTQAPDYAGSDPWAFMDVGKIRAIMGGMATGNTNFYQIQSSDLWYDTTYWNSLHPNCKYEQAVRAAKIACAANGEGGVRMSQAGGPVVESVTFSKDFKKATVKFKNVGYGLKTTDNQRLVKGFNVLLRNEIIYSYEVKARLVGRDTVEITCEYPFDGVAYNAITTYSFGNEITLENSAGIPAGAFLIKSENGLKF
ncbi:MAG: hypothetical protein J5912_04935 [Clostridia bacterium]|nr:hypothetical protein [Clostridia bacterium]